MKANFDFLISIIISNHLAEFEFSKWAINEMAKFKFQWNLFYLRVYLQDLHHLVMDKMIKIVSQAESSQSKKSDLVESGGQPALTCIVLMLLFEMHIAVLSTSQCDRLFWEDADILTHRNLKLNQQANPKWVADY